jgi:hypothetical protein
MATPVNIIAGQENVELRGIMQGCLPETAVEVWVPGCMEFDCGEIEDPRKGKRH